MIVNLLLYAMFFLVGLVAVWKTKDEAKKFSPNRYDDKVIEAVAGRLVLVDKRQ